VRNARAPLIARRRNIARAAIVKVAPNQGLELETEDGVPRQSARAPDAPLSFQLISCE